MVKPRVASHRETDEESEGSESEPADLEVDIDAAALEPDGAEASADAPAGESGEASPQAPGFPEGEAEAEVEEELADPVFSTEPTPGEDFFDDTDDIDDGLGRPAEGEPAFEKEAAPEEERKTFEESINAGFSRLAVVGLDDEFYVNEEVRAKDDLRDELREVFEEFQLGHYGDQVMKEYLLKDDDDIDPIWGFTGAMVLCFALTIYMRPDGDEILDRTADRISGLGGRLGR